WINGKTGVRSDVPHHLIYPLKETRPNLHIFTGIHVKHVTFDDSYTFNPLFHPDGPNETRTVRGTKLVVLSAGHSVLQDIGALGNRRQGILEGVGVKQRVDLPSIGENYHDHNILFIPYFAADEAQTLDAILRNDQSAVEAATAEFEKTGKGFMAQNGLSAGIKWRPGPSELPEFGPEFKKLWDAYFANAPDKPVLWMGVMSACVFMLALPVDLCHYTYNVSRLVGDPTLLPPRKFFTLGAYTEYPVARGHVHITHGEDVSAPLDFVPGYLESMADVKVLTWGYKFTREIARRMPHFRGEPPVLHPTFAPGSPAAIVPHAEGPVAFDTPRIEYSEEDERVLEAYARGTMNTTWHALGTCAMKPREKGGVVDSRLNVYGVSGLKIADLSIGPGNVAANTYSTALVIGEKAAIIIAEEMGIKGVV
ncbi:GMC oxidoreductase-domain-containing protein, partial [Russula aff. rugulosa BPL654]